MRERGRKRGGQNSQSLHLLVSGDQGHLERRNMFLHHSLSVFFFPAFFSRPVYAKTLGVLTPTLPSRPPTHTHPSSHCPGKRVLPWQAPSECWPRLLNVFIVSLGHNDRLMKVLIFLETDAEDAILVFFLCTYLSSGNDFRQLTLTTVRDIRCPSSLKIQVSTVFGHTTGQSALAVND